MKNHFGSLLGLVLAIGASNGARAQSEPLANTYALRVADLTSEERDAIALDLSTDGNVRMVFACVPAGIMVFSPEQNAGQPLRVRAMATVSSRTQAQRITEMPMDLHQAEAACANARNRQ